MVRSFHAQALGPRQEKNYGENAFRLFPVMEHRSGFSGIPTEVLVPLFGPILIRLQAAESLQGKPPESAWLEWGDLGRP